LSFGAVTGNRIANQKQERQAGAGIIGQLSFDNSQLAFPETTEFISVVLHF